MEPTTDDVRAAIMRCMTEPLDVLQREYERDIEALFLRAFPVPRGTTQADAIQRVHAMYRVLQFDPNTDEGAALCNVLLDLMLYAASVNPHVFLDSLDEARECFRTWQRDRKDGAEG